MSHQFDERGVCFQYPAGWHLDLSGDEGEMIITLQSPDGPAFAVVTLDSSRPSPSRMLQSALATMIEEYPDLEREKATESIGGYRALGHDLDFLSLDMPASCQIRCFRTTKRTVMILSQWSDLDEEEVPRQLRSLKRSFRETDSA